MNHLVLSVCLLFVLSTLTACPTLPVADPSTESRLSNRTSQAIEVEIVLNPASYGGHASTDRAAQSQDWLKEFAVGDGVEIVSLDTDRLSGRYRIAPSGFMILHASMGTKPRIHFSSMVITQGDRMLRVTGESNIAARFKETDQTYRYEFAVTADTWD